MKFRIHILAALLAAVACSACNGGSQNPPQARESKFAKYLWFDAEANFARFASQDSIRYWLDRTVEAGFNRIVVDVKPVEGDVLYKSDFMPELVDFRGTKVDRTWDYLQVFLDEAAKRNLRVTVSTTIFPVGLTATRQGPVYRDSTFDGRTCIQYKPEGMMDIRDDKPVDIAFLNPAMPENQEWALRFVREILTKYRFDAYALDYCRYPGATADFSEFSHRDFEKFLGHAVERFPEDIFTYDKDGNRVPGKYYKQWWEFRSMIIRDFVAEVRREIKAIKSDVKLEYWAASWWGALYANGQNWASNSYMPLEDVESSYYYIWCSNNYYRTGFAEELDTFLLGAYLERIYGADDNESVEYAINRAERMLRNACTMYGTIQCADPNFDIEEACYYCLKRTAGLMVFDIVHVINNNKWSAIKRGIDRALAEDRTNE